MDYGRIDGYVGNVLPSMRDDYRTVVPVGMKYLTNAVMRRLAALLLVLAVTTGCANVRYALEMTPQRTQEAFEDPVRRVHLATQTLRVLAVASTAISCLFVIPPPAGFLACPVLALASDFIGYEYVLEPLSKERVKEGKPSLVDAYWEGGPRHDEGERFINP